ncbi:D-alanyl-D-alanine carboxypeptidase family protein [Ammoniphilus resinae]|uniref:D-alanyl-D-alanine carboxypeptidase n=1 Tax=Ammoniphilus resinae TaxID=861532 RepID=A0ABS4GTA8_9BACL|nr:D-alanyl-D-alanine carboxypeptidase family protein [Ammoniphilus resinae]MBP1933515.1 D-alanyl-D-alanine carboxypeptidase [Ammoniphilus resinae]
MVRRKRWLVWMVILTFLFPLFSITSTEAAAAPSISAQAAAVIDVESGRILYEKNGNEKMRVASLTKIMTAIVAIEEGNLQEMVRVPSHAVGTEGSSIYLRKNEELSLEDLLYGLMLRSGNDAAVTIADHIGGSVEGFARLMNEKAQYLGLSGTHFTNPHGLDDSNNHFSTANDLAKLTAYALHNPDFKKIVATKVKKIPQAGEKWDRNLINKNKMLSYYEGADGVKTGYTKLAKRCLVSSATREERQVTVVTLNAPDDWDDHAKLLDYGMKQFTRTQIVSETEMFNNLRPIRSFYYPLAEGEAEHITKRVQQDQSIKSILPGGVAGYLHINLKDKEIAKIGLVYQTEESMKWGEGGPVTRFFQIFKSMVLGGL